jgi:outer membrane receptor protein involved in Fe transport
MSTRTYQLCRAALVCVLALAALVGCYDFAFSQDAAPAVALPQVNVVGEKQKPRPKPRPATRTATTRATAPAQTPAQQLEAKSNAFDQSRGNLYTTAGTTSDTISHETIEALPQGTNTTVEKVLLQAPGVSQDSAASGSIHVRNDHANVQYRINGVMLPDGVTGFGSVLDTGLIGTIALVTGALPAEFGLRTVGLVDITTRADAFNNSGSVSLYGGSRGTITPSFEYGGTFGGNCQTNTSTANKTPASWSAGDCFPGVQYFFSGRYLQTTEGIENPLPGLNAIHDFSEQQRGFAYMSAFVDPATRLSLIAGTAYNTFQIPNVPGQPNNPIVAPAPNFNSALLNENQTEFTQYAVLALQRSAPGFDGQISYFTRYNDLHFVPDPTGDLLLNGIASDISRQSYTNGVQADGSYVINPAHTVRAGFTVSAEQAWVDNSSIVEPCIVCNGTDSGAPQTITDDNAKLGWLAGIYVQDEWKITNQLTMNAGLRFDQMWQYTDANQLSPRLSFTYKPFEDTTLHAGYARYFTPPVLVEAVPANIALFNNTTAAPPAGQGNSPVLPERSHYFDAGVDQKFRFDCTSHFDKNCSTLEVGIDAYYKIAKDLIDNGNFGQALVLDAFNYAQGINEGVEFSAKYHNGNFDAYGNLSIAEQRATNVVSNQYLFDNTTPLADLGNLTEFQYIATHWIYTDHNQFVTGSAGVSYLWNGTRFSTDMIYGSGLRAGDANIGSESPYAQFNAGLSHEFAQPDGKPVTVRFDVVNLFDTVYQIRSGTGIGVFAPQYGPRRGYYVGISKKL